VGTVEICNITRGHRKTTILNLDELLNAEIIEISGSIVEKKPIYKTDANQAAKKKVPSIRSLDER
jgi:hypothetical protein